MPRQPAAPAKVPAKINPALEPLCVDIDTLKYGPKNRRLHGKQNAKAIRDSFLKHGVQKPIVVAQDGVTVSDGNERLRVAREELHWDRLPIVTYDGKTEVDARMYGVSANRSGELGEWDYKGLSEDFGEVREAGEEPESMGFTAGQVESMMMADWTPPPPPETQKKDARPRIILGDAQYALFQKAKKSLEEVASRELDDAAVVELLCERHLGDG
jgi:hypothetical protein